jgi:hypothetical protein
MGKYISDKTLLADRIYRACMDIRHYISGLCHVTSSVRVILRITGGIRLFSGAWLLVDEDIVNIHFRRACPFSECGGVMEPKNIVGVGPRWACRRNPRSHLIEYDHTQIANAIKKGQLASKIKGVMGESYRESRRRARQVNRADFP